MNWISVKDRLPGMEYDTRILVYYSGYPLLAVYSDGKFNELPNGEELNKVSHWMEITPPIDSKEIAPNDSRVSGEA